MLHIIVGVFLILHGAVHIWYVAMARGLISADADTIWNGRSWLFTRTLGDQVTMMLATIVHSITTLLFIVAGVGLVAQQDWWATWAVAGAILSIAGIVGFWDGKPDHPIEKGLLGIIIDVAILVAVLYFEWPSI
jgi:hypothetical protein